MANQKGSLIALSVESSTPSSYLAVGGLQNKGVRFNSQAVDTTDSESTDLWQGLLDGGGVKSMQISSSGLFEDDAAEERIRAQFITGSLTNFRISIPSWQQIDCLMQITDLQIDGQHNDAVKFAITLQSSGKPTFTAI